MIWYVYALAAALLLTMAVLLEKRNLNKIHALEFSTETSFYGLVLSMFLLPFVKWNFDFTSYLLILTCGITGIFAFLLFNKALRHAEVSEVAPLINFEVIFTLLFAIIILRDLPERAQIAGVLLIFVGAYLLELPTRGLVLSPFRSFAGSKSLAWLLVSMALYGFNRVIAKVTLEEVPPLSLVFFGYLIFFFGYSLINWLSFRENLTRLRSLLKLHGIGLFLTSLAVFGYRLVMTYALGAGSAPLTSAIARTSTFFTALAGGQIFSETHLKSKLIASLIILTGVVLIVI
ncbi:MAG: DMT family transporter [Candidatus Doudnabacteria bacterium]|nr:DMT family transporter [Candidatus Doudnabacteria bacterium]